VGLKVVAVWSRRAERSARGGGTCLKPFNLAISEKNSFPIQARKPFLEPEI